jgi:formylglycine-generating enzyme required for sulfatase activity
MEKDFHWWTARRKVQRLRAEQTSWMPARNMTSSSLPKPEGGPDHTTATVAYVMVTFAHATRLRGALCLANLTLAVLLGVNGCMVRGGHRYPDDKTIGPGSPIAVCGGGLDSKARIDVEAAYQKSGGKFSAEFVESVRAALTSSLSPGDVKVLTDCFERTACENRVESRCTMQRESCLKQYRAPYEACLERPRRSCIRDCIRKFGNSFDRCSEYYCSIDEKIDAGRSNLASWSKLCLNDLDALGKCEEEYRGCLSRGDCRQSGATSEPLRAPLAEVRVEELKESAQAVSSDHPVRSAHAALGKPTPPVRFMKDPVVQASTGVLPHEAADDMVSVPAGEFFFGCNELVDRQCEDYEKPGRRLTLGHFRIDRTEVTVAAYRRCVNGGGCPRGDIPPPLEQRRSYPAAGLAGGVCNWDSGREQHPMNCVNWHQASAFCTWAGKRLPTEFEWEKAARGIDGRMYAWGNDAGGPPRAHITWVRSPEQTSPVGIYPADKSPYGAFDMTGNVSEWCEEPRGDVRISRGGHFGGILFFARLSRSDRQNGRGRSGTLGFRCAK